jgi:germination protein M
LKTPAEAGKEKPVSVQKKTLAWVMVLCIMVSLCGCGRSTAKDEGHTYQIYYIDHDENKIVPVPYTTGTTDQQQLMSEMLQKLSDSTGQMQYEAPIDSSFSMKSAVIKSGQAVIDFDSHYLSMDTIREILVRAALVRTLTQITGITSVSVTVKGEALTDQSGKVVGPMTADMFIDNAGKEIDSSQKVKLDLYFADKNGDRLIETNRTVIYNSNISMEKLIVEQIISGPVIDSVYPVINPDTKLISATTKDGVCYVNFDKSFLTQTNKVTDDVAIYSIVNSLVELPDVNKVQFSVDGDTNISYHEKKNLSAPLERNLDIVQ